jgi:hypothetical protein
MHLDFAVLADGVAQRPDGKLDIFGAGIDRVHAATAPAVHPRFALAARFRLTREELDGTHRLEVILRTVGGTVLARAVGALDPMPDEVRGALDATQQQFGIGAVFNFDNAVFPDFGAYEVVLRWDDEDVRDPLPLVVGPPPDG